MMMVSLELECDGHEEDGVWRNFWVRNLAWGKMLRG